MVNTHWLEDIAENENGTVKIIYAHESEALRDVKTPSFDDFCEVLL